MRPSIARLSDMPGPKVYSLWWGDKSGIKQNGIITYTISPFQAKAAPNMFRTYLLNGLKRVTSPAAIIFYVPMAIGYYTFNWANAKYEYLHSKAYHLEQLANGDHGHDE